MNIEAYEEIFSEIKDLSYHLSEARIETWQQDMVLSPLLPKTLKVQHIRSILLSVLTNHSSYLFYLWRVQMELSSANHILPMKRLEILNLADPTCIDDVKYQTEQILENTEKIDNLLLEWKADLMLKLEAVKEFELVHQKMKKKRK